MSIDALATGFRQQGEKIHFLYIHTIVHNTTYIKKMYFLLVNRKFIVANMCNKSEPHFLSDKAL